MLIFEVLSSVAAHGKASEDLARKEGEKRAKKKGVALRKPKDLYPQDSISPFTIIATQRKAVKAGVVSMKAVWRMMRGGQGDFWVRKQFKLMQEIENKGGQKLVDEWLEVVEYIREAESRRGVGARDKRQRHHYQSKSITQSIGSIPLGAVGFS